MSGEENGDAPPAIREAKESGQEDDDASRVVQIEENGKEEDDQDFERVVSSTSRGFSGAPKFSDFRRTMTTANTSATANSPTDVKEGTKEDKLDAKEKEGESPIDRLKTRGVDTSAVDEELDQTGIIEKISEQLSIVKQEIRGLTKDIAHEVKELYDKAVKGGHEP